MSFIEKSISADAFKNIKECDNIDVIYLLLSTIEHTLDFEYILQFSLNKILTISEHTIVNIIVNIDGNLDLTFYNEYIHQISNRLTFKFYNNELKKHVSKKIAEIINSVKKSIYFQNFIKTVIFPMVFNENKLIDKEEFIIIAKEKIFEYFKQKLLFNLPDNNFYESFFEDPCENVAYACLNQIKSFYDDHGPFMLKLFGFLRNEFCPICLYSEDYVNIYLTNILPICIGMAKVGKSESKNYFSNFDLVLNDVKTFKEMELNDFLFITFYALNRMFNVYTSSDIFTINAFNDAITYYIGSTNYEMFEYKQCSFYNTVTKFSKDFVANQNAYITSGVELFRDLCVCRSLINLDV